LRGYCGGVDEKKGAVSEMRWRRLVDSGTGRWQEGRGCFWERS